MYVSLKWLAQHVDLEGITPKQLADDLTRLFAPRRSLLSYPRRP